ncbi:MAG: hypothetical protein HC872_08425 [Gammaproteobacteria bacterium]|nr:hypothetical protein [Gammaproteobacteria bacterium]
MKYRILALALAASLAALSGCSSGDAGRDIIAVGGGVGTDPLPPPPPVSGQDPIPVPMIFAPIPTMRPAVRV